RRPTSWSPHALVHLADERAQRGGYPHRVRRRGLEAAQRVGQARKLRRGAGARLGERRQRPDAPPAPHHGRQQGLALLRIGLQREDVLAHAPIGAVAAVDLLAAGIRRLALGALAARDARVLLELVGAVE